MADFPTGTVSFLFTDIEGSTRLLQQLGEAYRVLLDEHHRILRGAIEQAGGVRVSTNGDGVFGVFASPRDAVTAAASAQLALARQSWPSEVEVRVRMGIHTGEGVIGADGYLGLDVHRAARIASVANGGQVVVSDATRSLVQQGLSGDLGLLDLGLHRLKDLTDAEHIYQLLITGLPTEFPPLRSLDAVRNNLPMQLTSFVGRGAELADLDKLLRVSRLVTLTGVGGTGKTRLAYQLAADASHEFPDGVWVAELASLTDPDLVANALATEMGLHPQPGESIRKTLASVVGHQTVLVILDNCEHLLDASADLASELLQAGPGVKVMATSREALGVAGEVSYPVASLGVPRGELPEGESALRYDAVELFVERAALVRPGFLLTAENVEAVVQICRRLDGVPLAIELAAARIRSLSPEDIAGRLDDRFRLLTGGSRTSLPRQQTLEATVAWSYEHLTEVEKLVFARLSVFSGGFTLESAELVCAGDGLGLLDVADVVLGLVDKSLVAMDQDETRTRYRLLETLRQYARDRLPEQSDPDHFRHKHAGTFADLGEQLAPALQGRDQVEAFRQLEAEHDNFRGALTWAQEAPDPVLVLRMVAALARFWEESGHWIEGRIWKSMAAIEDETLPLDLQIKAALGGLDMTLSEDKTKLAALTQQALERARRLGDQALIGRAMAAHGLAIAWLGESDESIEMLESAVQLFRAGDDQWELADALKNLGNVLSRTGSDESEAALLGGLEIFRGLGDRLRSAEVLHYLGVNGRNAEPDNVGAWAEESLELYRELGSRSGEGHALLGLGQLQRSRGEDAAYPTLTEGLQVLTDVGDQNCASVAQREMALLEIENNPDGAEGRLRTALTMGTRVDNVASMALTMETLGKLAVRAGEVKRAVSLYGAAERLLAASGRSRTRTTEADRQPEFDLARERLDEAAYQEARDAGAAMTADEAVGFALRQNGAPGVRP
jgi:predicted ATPase/class 3 adenylate cyclase